MQQNCMNNPPFVILKPKAGTAAAAQIADNSGIVGLEVVDAAEPSYLVYLKGISTTHKTLPSWNNASNAQLIVWFEITRP
jgi:hypothetical protein